VDEVRKRTPPPPEGRPLPFKGYVSPQMEDLVVSGGR
jgi:hypothetical protein